jgi:hypothetical protein
LSGIGFSSTRGDKVIAIADGRTFEIQFWKPYPHF